ncbi:hypothetical protein EAH_00066640 [Eimeria acervulina]|uniref:Uncharacterized protein n=1 Tax=Eimeria acervulina TaxID=5801 RepID=U6GQL0_EIMAC|nr:hypothetical protein EAH_00066640 [Eimeria acervulina]CDI82490.1 hypothetical protein EAH_00066640 [Eimeria acervulina]
MALGRQFQGWFKDARERQKEQTQFLLLESMAAQARRPLETCDNELMTSKCCNRHALAQLGQKPATKHWALTGGNAAPPPHGVSEMHILLIDER